MVMLAGWLLLAVVPLVVVVFAALFARRSRAPGLLALGGAWISSRAHLYKSRRKSPTASRSTLGLAPASSAGL